MITREWLNESPDISDLTEVRQGVYTHPYDAIVRKLHWLCPDGWDTQNFQHQFFIMPDGNVKVSGSIEVVVEYKLQEDEYSQKDEQAGVPHTITKTIKRVLSGAATFSTTDYSNENETNEHFAATVKSLAVVNAVQVLGKQFGWGLNDGTTLPVQQIKDKPKKRKPALLEPDQTILQQFDNAVESGDLKRINLLLNIYNINLEGTDYASKIEHLKNTDSQ